MQDKFQNFAGDFNRLVEQMNSMGSFAGEFSQLILGMKNMSQVSTFLVFLTYPVAP